MPVDGAVVAAVIGDKIYVVVSYAKVCSSTRQPRISGGRWRQGRQTRRCTHSRALPWTARSTSSEGQAGADRIFRSRLNDLVDIYDPVTNTWSRGRATPMRFRIW